MRAVCHAARVPELICPHTVGWIGQDYIEQGASVGVEPFPGIRVVGLVLGNGEHPTDGLCKLNIPRHIFPLLESLESLVEGFGGFHGGVVEMLGEDQFLPGALVGGTFPGTPDFFCDSGGGGGGPVILRGLCLPEIRGLRLRRRALAK